MLEYPRRALPSGDTGSGTYRCGLRLIRSGIPPESDPLGDEEIAGVPPVWLHPHLLTGQGLHQGSEEQGGPRVNIGKIAGLVSLPPPVHDRKISLDGGSLADCSRTGGTIRAYGSRRLESLRAWPITRTITSI